MSIETIAIIGAGELGRAWARRALGVGYRTILEDVSLSRLEQGAAAIRGLRSANGAQLVTASSVAGAVREADLIIETVSDELEMKLELFTLFDKFAKPGAIFASTTNTISVADLADMTFCPERCIGMRLGFAGGVELMELVMGPRTAQETVTRCRDVALRMGLAVRMLPDKPTSSPDDGS